MRIRDTSHWSDLKSLEGLLFFSQSIDEMLFDYTLDSYKPSALNCKLLCLECYMQISEVKNGFIAINNLVPIVEELKWSLNSDLAAKSILGYKVEFYLHKLQGSINKLEELRNLVSYLITQLSEKRYLDKIKELLTSYVQDGKNKAKIRHLTSTYLTELINHGFHPADIFYQNLNFFFAPNKRAKIEKPNEIADFFSLFNFEKKEYNIVFIGGIIFREFRNTLNKYNISVSKNYNCYSKMQDDVDFSNSRKEDESFIFCSKIEAYDHYSAREVAETFLGQVTGIFNFFHHKRRADILDKAIVQRTADNYVIVMDKPTKSILKIKSDMSPKDAAEEVANTIAGLELDGNSTYRFSRSIDLHSAALSAVDIENQLLDLWAALETLMPKSYESKQSRIDQICKSLIPFVQHNYFHKILNELHAYLKDWDEIKTEEILNEVPDSLNYSDLEKIAALVSLEGCKAIRTKLYVLMDEYPLLKNRIFTLHELVQSPNSIKKALDFHKLKSEWHIRRIYRTRGQIIHSGKFPTFTSILIENLHSYLDIFLKKVITLSRESKIVTIEQGVLEMQLRLDYQYSLLVKHQGEVLTAENFKEALLGSS